MEKLGSPERASAADRIDALLWFVIPVESVARAFYGTTAEGIRILTAGVEGCLDAGRRVVLIDIFDTPPDRNSSAPWSAYPWSVPREGWGRSACAP